MKQPRFAILVLFAVAIAAQPVFPREAPVIKSITRDFPVAGDPESIDEGPLQIYENPAGISFVRYPVISIFHNAYIHGINGEAIGFFHPFRNYAFGAAPAGYGMEQNNINAAGSSRYNGERYSGMVLPIAFSYLVNNFSIGTALRYYSDELNEYTYGITTIDMSSLLRLDRINFGINGLCLSGKVDCYDLPRKLKSGFGVVYNKFSLSTEYDRQFAANSDAFGFGGEYMLTRALCVRSGYKMENGLSAGFGVRLQGYAIDYSFLEYDELGIAHRAGVSMMFGNAQKKTGPGTEKSKENN